MTLSLSIYGLQAYYLKGRSIWDVQPTEKFAYSTQK